MRRALLIGMSIAAFGLSPALADEPAGPVVPVGPQDHVLGPAGAPVTVIEYASLTCPHCGKFETTVFPQIKKDLIDTGKIRFAFRDFPLDGAALKAAQIAHCGSDEGQYWGFLELEFRNQATWAFGEGNPVDALIHLSRLGGLSEEAARTCMADENLARTIVDTRKGGEDAGVDGTPTFFVNGKKAMLTEISYESFVKLLHDSGS
jgi:protein-disulfide isomerase